MHFAKKIVSFIAPITLLLLPSCTIYLPSASAVVGGGGYGGGGCNSGGGRPVMMQGGRPVMVQGGRSVMVQGGHPVGGGSMGVDMNPGSRYFEGRYLPQADQGYNPNNPEIRYTSGGRTVRVGRF